MSDPIVTTTKDERGVHTITLNRPDKRNALCVELLLAYYDAVREAEAGQARVIVVRGAGKVFCAGLDLKEAQDAAMREQTAQCVAYMLLSTYQAKAVTIAAVHGAALAGGAGLMSTCDLVIAEEGTKIGYPEVRRGLVAGMVMTFLRRRVGEGVARELLLLGDAIDAQDARDMGLVNRVAPTGTLDDAVADYVALALKGAPQALTRTKAFLNEIAGRKVVDDVRAALDQHLAARKTKEAAEGMAAFLENRLPDWDPDA
jgi:methylglutaconyl-CoA hydratase